MNGDSPTTASVGDPLTNDTNDGRRLYVGNLSYAATVGHLREFFNGFSL